MKVVLVLAFVCLTSSFAKKQEEDEEERALGPVSPRFLQRRATTVFFEDFSSGHFDRSHWDIDATADGIGAHAFQLYSTFDENLYVKNGKLYIRPTLTSDHYGEDFLAHGTFDARKEFGYCSPTWVGCWKHGWNEIPPTMSAQIRSKASIKYGKVEVMAKLSRGDWLWPSIWMMPADPNRYGEWPKSGEIDLTEACGNEHYTYSNGDSAGIDLDRSHIHYGNNQGDGHRSKEGNFRLQGSTFADNFHRFWLDWNQDHIRIGVDEHTTLTVNTPSSSFWWDGHFNGNNIWEHGGKNAPFDQPFYLILNVAVGGNFFWDGYHNRDYDKPWSSHSSTQMMDFWNNRNKWHPTWHGEDVAMQIDWVKMTQY